MSSKCNGYQTSGWQRFVIKLSLPMARLQKIRVRRHNRDVIKAKDFQQGVIAGCITPFAIVAGVVGGILVGAAKR